VDLVEADRVSFRDTGEIGAYRVLVNGVRGARFAFVVDAPSGESDLVTKGPPEQQASPEAAASDASQGVEQPLAPWLLLLAMALVFAELGLRQIRRR
jgi:hypothetical protein